MYYVLDLNRLSLKLREIVPYITRKEQSDIVKYLLVKQNDCIIEGFNHRWVKDKLLFKVLPELEKGRISFHLPRGEYDIKEIWVGKKSARILFGKSGNSYINKTSRTRMHRVRICTERNKREEGVGRIISHGILSSL